MNLQDEFDAIYLNTLRDYELSRAAEDLRAAEREAARRVVIEAQGNLFKVRFSRLAEEKRGGGRRGKVEYFSKASRKRLLERFARLDPRPGAGSRHAALFLTLTYGAEFPDARSAKRDLDSFLKRLRRKYPRSSAIWRLEFQKRGAPHFHLVVFGVRFIPKAWIQNAWGSIIDFERPFTKVEAVRGFKKLLGYVAKYVAKADNKDDSGVGLMMSHNSPDSPGRFWGVFNEEHLPIAGRLEFRAFDGAWTEKLAQSARSEWAGVPRCKGRGFSLFTEDADGWIDRAFALSGEVQ